MRCPSAASRPSSSPSWHRGGRIGGAIRLPTTLASTLVLLAALTPAAQAAPHLAGTFELSGTPGQITRDSDDNVWVTISNSDDNNNLARIKPNGNVKEYSPAALVNPVGIILGQDGNLWCTRSGGVVRVPPDDPDSAQDFDINEISDPRRITKGPQGKLWTASGDKLIRFEPDDPNGYKEDTIAGMAARGIASSGGFLWIADFGGQRIVRAKPNGVDTKNYNVGGGPQEVAQGPNDGIAYANPGTNPHTVGRIKKDGGAKTTNDPNSDPFGLVFAKDRNWWVAEFAKDKMGILSTNGDLEHLNLPNNSGPRFVTKGEGSTLWVSLETSGEVARIRGVN